MDWLVVNQRFSLIFFVEFTHNSETIRKPCTTLKADPSVEHMSRGLGRDIWLCKQLETIGVTIKW